MGTFPDRVPIVRDDYGIRKITPYECLALQGFPKEYRFPKIPMASAYKQCGNSVVVPVIRRIAEKIKEVFHESIIRY
jgi:DNA (cytosine-5)-methyltransferase 1